MENFGALPEEYTAYEGARVVIQPIPFDGTSTWGKGADKGPMALLEASANMELYDIETDTEPYTIGIATMESLPCDGTVEQMVAASYESTKKQISNGKYVVSIGGEHSVSIGPILAHAAEYEDLTVLQIDAHTDLRQEYEGSKYNHACVMARAREVASIVQVGIRSMDSSELEGLQRERVFWAHEIVGQTGWEQRAIDLISPRVYITIDLDGFDPAVLSNTGTPEPGGLEWHPTLRFLRRVFETREVVGFDIVELCPTENAKPSSFLAAKLLYRMLSFRFHHLLSKVSLR